MASRFAVRSPKFSSRHLESAGSEDRAQVVARAPYASKFSWKEQENYGSPTNNILRGFLFKRCISLSHKISSRGSSSKSLSSIASSGMDQITAEDESSLGMTHKSDLEINRVDCLAWVLHESARSFSLAIQTLQLARCHAELSNAWNGVDVNAWHKRTAYQVAVYALLKAAIEVELFLSHKRSNSPVCEILSPKTLFLRELVETQLNAKNPKLVQWFKMVELPRIAGLFIPLFKKWSVEYAGSGVAGVILAISCCTAVRKLGPGRIACPSFTASIDDVLVELMDLSRSLVSVDKLHQLAMEAGFEDDFLLHFGKKVLPSKNIEDVEFWIGLVQKKIALAFHRESVITGKQTFGDKVEETTLAILGIFAFLGRETRLFLSEMHIKDLDEQTKDFLSYLECGSLYIYPEFNSVPVYQHFIEVVVDEIGWLDFYSPLKCKFRHDGRRSRQHATQAEKEIILYTVLTVCYDVFSGFAHYSNSSKQPLDADLLSFLFRSQHLLSNCLEDYWAAYDKSGEMLKFEERVGSDSTPSVQTNEGTTTTSISLEVEQKMATSFQGCEAETKPFPKGFVRESAMKLITAGNDIRMGTQLLFIDVADALGLLVKKMHGSKITKRERRKIKRTLSDLANLVPVTILMLIPVSAIGHAALLAVIKKYMPSLIPSPYSSERLNLVKQLERTKKMEVESWGIDDPGKIRETAKEIDNDNTFTVTMP